MSLLLGALSLALAGPVEVDPDRLEADLLHLAGGLPLDGAPVVSRHVSHPDHDRVGAWLKAELERIDGLQVREEPFTAEEGTGLRNLVADLPGTEEGPWVVLGAHWDSTASADAGWNPTTDPAPGADDDASGVSAVLELARALSTTDHGLPIRFVLFDAEEQGLIGSAVHAQGMADRGEEVALMWSLDPIGYNHNGGNLMWVTYDERWETPGRDLEDLAVEVAPELLVTALDRKLIGGGNRSDHASFWDQDFPALHVASYPQPESYHTMDDTLDGVDRAYHRSVTALIGAHVDAVAGPPGEVEGSGCGCASSGGSVGGGLGLVAVLGVLGLRRRRRLGLGVLLGLGFSGSAFGQAVPIGPFPGSHTESWESAITGSFPYCQDVSTLGTACADTSYYVPASWPYACTLNPHDGSWFGGNIGPAVFDFTVGIEAFGGYFSSHVGGGYDVVMRFYDSGGTLVDTVTEPLGACVWEWRGYSFPVGVTRIEMESTFPGGSYVMTDDLRFDEAAQDSDGDGVLDDDDNCVDDPNPSQTDSDGDGVGDVCDVCPAGPDDVDADGDGVPDACDVCGAGDDGLDGDGDGVPDACDVCLAGPDDQDADGDGIPDDCDLCVGPDADGDGWADCDDCDDADPWLNHDDADGDGQSTCAGDCDDFDHTIAPGATELPDGRDQDCDGTVDEGTIWYDDDGDGVTEAGGDCDDADAGAEPGAAELCDGVDQDCDGTVDEGTDCTDDDGDGLAELDGDCNDADPLIAPTAPEVPENGIDDDCDGDIDFGGGDQDGDGYQISGGDCDDADGAVHPGAPEVCDGVDQDCDGTVDEGTDCFDDDGDGFTEQDGDCNDADDRVAPGAAEQANGVDDDCDGLVDEGGRFTDDDGDGFTEDQGDCDDADPIASPDGIEQANGADDDCDGLVDEGLDDADGDGLTALQGDCDDTDGWVNPGAAELCDDVDNDCDGEVDESCDGVRSSPKSAAGCGCTVGSGPVGGWLGWVLLAATAGAGRRCRPGRRPTRSRR